MRKMKDSGIEWIGEIPEDWKITTIGNLFFAKAGGDVKPNYYSYEKDDKHPFPVYTNSLDKNQIYAYTSTPIFPKNSITVTGRGDIGHAIFRDTEFDAIIRLNVLTSKIKLDEKYYTYFIDTVIPFFTNSAAIGQLSANQITPYRICYLPFSEQQKISAFLDRKCTEIDSVISKTKATIEEYKKLKQSVITQAVTKGIIPNRPMKDSGIEWIGEIPQEWETIRIGRLFRLRNEKNYSSLDEVRLLSLYTGIGVFPHGEHEERGNKAVTAEGYNIVKKNDIVVNIILAWMGAIGISEYDGVTSPAYDVYIPDLSKVVPHYFHYVFRTQGIAGECYKYGRGIMMMRWRTYSPEFKVISVPYPSIKEQQEIANYLDAKCSEIDKLIAKKEQLLTEMENYKKAVIYEYVTGKKEV